LHLPTGKAGFVRCPQCGNRGHFDTRDDEFITLGPSTLDVVANKNSTASHATVRRSLKPGLKLIFLVLVIVTSPVPLIIGTALRLSQHILDLLALGNAGALTLYATMYFVAASFPKKISKSAYLRHQPG